MKFLGVKSIDSWGDGAGFYLPIGSTQLALKLNPRSPLSLLPGVTRRIPILILSLTILNLHINILKIMALLPLKSMILAE